MRRTSANWPPIAWALAVATAIGLLGYSAASLVRAGVLGDPWFRSDFTNHLGAEYNYIAQSLLAGRGFADPFGRPTGPTAWMPPVLPSLLAMLHWVTGGDMPSVVLLARGLQLAAVVVSLAAVLWTVSSSRYRWWFAAVTLLAVWANFYYLFQFTHDHALLMVVTTLIWVQLVRFPRVPASRWAAVPMGIFGGLAALCSPVAGFVWAALSAVCYRRRPAFVAILALSSMAVVAPWVIRGRLVLGHWVPIKSNAAYELYQSQVVDDDGVLDVDDLRRHPYYARSEAAEQYDRLGERRFLDRKRDEFWQSVRDRPWKFARRVANRFSSAFLWPEFYHRWYQVPWQQHYPKAAWTVISTLAAVLVGLIAPERATRGAKLALAIWLLYLLPYVLTSYYERYDIPTFPMRLIVIFGSLEIGIGYSRDRFSIFGRRRLS